MKSAGPNSSGTGSDQTSESWASSPRIRRSMLSNRSRDTRLELAVRRELFRMGFRYRTHRRPLPDLACRADIVFAGIRLAVFLDGCFWHGCPEHGRRPSKTAKNRDWWLAKLDRNAARDRRNVERLASERWNSLRIWEHEETSVAVQRIALVAGLLKERQWLLRRGSSGAPDWRPGRLAPGRRCPRAAVS
jgi:DNA mismatch endonuclease, patch repair protein